MSGVTVHPAAGTHDSVHGQPPSDIGKEMIVAREISRDAITFGLTAPMRLQGGGDLLAPEGFPLSLGMDHQPEFIRAVADACRRQVKNGREWYSHGAMALVGPAGGCSATILIGTTS